MFRFPKIKIDVKEDVGVLAQWLLKQMKDKAVHRALLLGGAAYLIRRATFLDNDTAQGLTDKVLAGGALVLSKLPGSVELANQKEAAPTTQPTEDSSS